MCTLLLDVKVKITLVRRSLPHSEGNPYITTLGSVYYVIKYTSSQHEKYIEIICNNGLIMYSSNMYFFDKVESNDE
jgi:hypothetical protein